MHHIRIQIVVLRELKLTLYRIKDHTVPYPSALIETSDPFLNWEDQGVEVEANEDGIMQSWRLGAKDDGDDDDEGLSTGRPKGKKRARTKLNWASRMVGNLPPVLRYRFPFNYVSGESPSSHDYATKAIRKLSVHLHWAEGDLC